MPGVELVTVLVEDHVLDPVQPVLDTPMTLDEVSEVSGAGLAGIEGGDQVNHPHTVLRPSMVRARRNCAT